MKKTRLNLLILFTALGATISGCGDGEAVTPSDTEKKVTVKASASYSNVTPKAGGRLASTTSVSDFWVNIKNITLEIDEKDQRSNHDSIFEDPGFDGPFLVDLLSDSLAVTLAGVDVPQGIYSEVEFDISPSNDANSIMQRKSILIKGEFEGVPFVFWTDDEEGFEIEFPVSKGSLTIGDIGFVLNLNFDLEQLFGASGLIDLSQAMDGNGDGLIEIYPGDPDGNEHLVSEILHGLDDATEIDEDEDLDEDGKENSEDDDIDGDGIQNDQDDDDDSDGIKDEDDSDADGDGHDDSEDKTEDEGGD